MSKKSTLRKKKIRELTIDVRGGTDKYHIDVGKTGWSSMVFRNGKVVNNIDDFKLHIPSDGIPKITLVLNVVEGK